MYVLKFTDSAVADVRLIPKHLRNALRKELLDKVRVDPFGCSKELKDPLKEFRSFQWQGYRVVYRIFPELRAVAIVGVGLRSPQSTANIYRKLERLADAGQLAQGVLFSIRGFSEPPLE